MIQHALIFYFRTGRRLYSGRQIFALFAHAIGASASSPLATSTSGSVALSTARDHGKIGHGQYTARGSFRNPAATRR